jgi:hypothetical protein
LRWQCCLRRAAPAPRRKRTAAHTLHATTMSAGEDFDISVKNPMVDGSDKKVAGGEMVTPELPAGSKLQGAPARIVQCAELQLQTKLSAWEAGERAFSGPPLRLPLIASR